MDTTTRNRYYDKATGITYYVQGDALYHTPVRGYEQRGDVYCIPLAYAGHYARNVILAGAASPDLERWIDTIRSVYAVGITH